MPSCQALNVGRRYEHDQQKSAFQGSVINDPFEKRTHRGKVSILGNIKVIKIYKSSGKYTSFSLNIFEVAKAELHGCVAAQLQDANSDWDNLR